MKAMALVTREKGKLGKIEEVNIPEPKANDVIVKMVAVGVCHTDHNAIDQDLPTQLPAVMGHEGSGIVEAVGANVTEVKPGDKVVVGIPWCGECGTCMIGHPAQCERTFELSFFGSYVDGERRLTDKDGNAVSSFFAQGTFSTYAIADIHNIVKLPEEVTMEELPYMGPLACGQETGSGTVLNVLQVKAGSSIAIFGCGAVGLAAIMAAKIGGCLNIIGVDVVDSRLELAKELGATHVINGKNADAVAEIMKITGKGCEYAIDNTANVVCINQALDCLAFFGTAITMGTTGPNKIPVLPQTQLMVGQKALVGAIQGDVRPKEWIPKLVKWYKQGKFPFDKLIKFYDFNEEQIEKAFADSKNGTTIKPVIRF